MRIHSNSTTSKGGKRVEGCLKEYYAEKNVLNVCICDECWDRQMKGIKSFLASPQGGVCKVEPYGCKRDISN